MFSTQVRLPPFDELMVSLTQPQPYKLVLVPVVYPLTSSGNLILPSSYINNYTSTGNQPTMMMPTPIKQPHEPQNQFTIPASMADIPTPPSSTELSNKTSTSEPVTKKTYACKTCGRAFTTLGHLARHNRTHTGERKHACPWPLCEARFARQDNCMQHFKMHLKGKDRRYGKRKQL